MYYKSLVLVTRLGLDNKGLTPFDVHKQDVSRPDLNRTHTICQHH